MITKTLKSTFLVFLCINSVVLRAQTDSTFLYPIRSTEAGFEGAGVEWITGKQDSLQFVFFGEQHGVEGVAQFVQYIKESLTPSGFHYLILETDKWTAQRSAELGVDAFTQANPHSIAFDSNGDLDLMQSAIDPSIENPIWGMDQMVTAIHPFKRLVDLAETSQQRRLARGAYFKAVLKMGRYLRQSHFQDLLRLEEAFASLESQEKALILRELRISMDIYIQWMDPATRNASVARRETFMMENFDAYFENAPNTKGILKMGGAHTRYGVGPNGILTLGDYIQKSANNRGGKTLNINIFRYNEENSFVPASSFGDQNMLLLDTKKYLTRNPDQRANSQLVGFDALIYVKGTGWADKSINRGYEKQFRNGFIMQILPLGICSIIGLFAIISTLVNLFRKHEKSIKIAHTFIGVGSALALTLIIIQVVQIVKGTYSASISSLSAPGIQILLAAFTFYLVVRSVLIYRINLGSATFKRYILIISINAAILSYLIHYWNIGGMMG